MIKKLLVKFAYVLILSFSIWTVPSFAADVPRKKILRKIIENNQYPDWMIRQIELDLAPFSKEQFSERALDAYIESLSSNLGIYRVKIVNGQLDFRTFGDKEWQKLRVQMLREAFEQFVRELSLPDVDFICCVKDFWPQSKVNIPLFVFAKNADANHVMMPDFEILFGYGNLNQALSEAKIKYRWKQKKEIAFWRGATTGGQFVESSWKSLPRSRLVLLSLQYPSLVDAKFTMFSRGAEHNAEMLAMPKLVGARVTQGESLQFKYLVDVDGNSCGYQRLYWTLLSNCAVFKQMSNNIQWYYGALNPYVHYIPIAHDCSDLIEKVNWAREHDLEVRKIADNGTRFAERNLQLEHVYAYLYLLLKTYAEKQCSN